MNQLDNGLIRLEFDPRSGALRSLRDLRNGQEHLPDARTANLFRLIVPSARWDSRYADAGMQIARLEQRDGSIVIHYDRLKFADGTTLPIALRVTVKLPSGSPEAFFEMAITNNSADPIIEVCFPRIAGWTGYVGAGKDQLLLGSGMKAPVDPHGYFGEYGTAFTFERAHQRASARFPLETFVPWLDLSGGGRGTWIIHYMQRARVGGFFVENMRGHEAGQSLALGWYFHPEIKQGTTWSSGSFGVGLHQGDWHETARHYRDWLRAWWKPAPATERLRRTMAIQNVLFTGFDGRPIRPFSALPQVAKDGLQNGVRDLCVWDHLMLGTYARLDPRGLTDYPKEQWEELRHALAEARQLDCRISMLINHRVVGQHSEFFRNGGERGALRLRDGSLKVEAYPAGSHTAEFFSHWRGPQSVVMCQHSREFREEVNHHLDRLLDVGFNAFFIDQAFEDRPCYAANHGHTSPDDTTDSIVEWVGEFRKRLLARHPDAYMIGEMSDVFVSQVIDLSWNWFWPTNLSRAEVIAYSLPGTLHGWVSDRDVTAAQQAFLHGFLVLLNTRGLEGTLSDAPEFAHYIAQLAKLRERTAHCTTFACFEDDMGLTCEGALAKRYSSASDDSSVVVINPTDKQARARIRLEEHPRAGKLHHLDGRTEEVGNKSELELAVAPRDVVIWEQSN